MNWWSRQQNTPSRPGVTNGHQPYPYTGLPPKPRPAETNDHRAIPFVLGASWIAIGTWAAVLGVWPLTAVAVVMTGLMAALATKERKR